MSMNSIGYQAYRKTQIQTADQGSLILMCYDGAINFLKQAKLAHGNGDFASRGIYYTKAQNILWELTNSLNLEAGEIALTLQSLYNYMIRKILDAEYHGNMEATDEVIGHLQDLRESWVRIIKKQTS
ncbi:MAG: flagellar export chaperone FliS [Desulfomonilia bacterium]